MDHHGHDRLTEHAPRTASRPAALAMDVGMLRCPRCGHTLDLTPVPAPPDVPEALFGVLTCGEHEFPVLDGIPVLREGRVDVQDHVDGRTEVVGPTVAELVTLVRGPDPLEALVTLLAFPPALPGRLETMPGLRLPWTRGPGGAVLLHRRRRLVRRMLTTDRAVQTAQDWMELSFLRSRNVGRELYPYFLARFGQPRHLASLALLSVLTAADKPVLDLACGFGHILHNLAHRRTPVLAVGVDRGPSPLPWTQCLKAARSVGSGKYGFDSP